MKVLVFWLAIICLILTNVILPVRATRVAKAAIDPSEAVKKWLEDQKFVDENFYHQEMHEEKILDYDSGVVKKTETKYYGFLFFNEKLRRQEIFRDLRPADNNLASFKLLKNNNLDFDKFILDWFSFVESDSDIETSSGRKFFTVAFRALGGVDPKVKARIRGYDVRDVLNKIVGEIEVWDNGNLKSIRVSLSKDASVDVWGALAGGKIKILNVVIITQAIDNGTRIVPLRADIEYKFTSTGLAKMVVGGQHKKLLIIYSDYRKMTFREKYDFLLKKPEAVNGNKVP